MVWAVMGDQRNFTSARASCSRARSYPLLPYQANKRFLTLSVFKSVFNN
jgi:hypothetical protein